MHNSECECRKLKSGQIPFSPEAALWIKRTLVYRLLLRYWAGKTKNKGNLLRQARHCHITNPLSLSIKKMRDRLAECKRRCRYFTKHGHRHRKTHQMNRLQIAQDKRDEEAEQRILQIISGEHDKAFWRRLNWALGSKRGKSVRSIQVKDKDGQVTEFDTQP